MTVSRRTFIKKIGGVVIGAAVLGLSGLKLKALAQPISSFVTLPEGKTIDPVIVINLIDKLKKHKGIKSLKLKWYLVPHPDDDTALLFIARKKLKEYPDCDFLGGSLLLDLVKTDMNMQIDNLFLSLEDKIEYDSRFSYTRITL